MTDSELLNQFARSRSQEAFAVLVERYIRLVYSACRRQLGDAQLAEDAAQMVFGLLSQKAATLRRTELSGWLLTTARFTCANLHRQAQRRREREKVAAMNANHSINEPDSELLEMLDDGLLRLGATDRAALVLRFLQNEPLRQVGEILGLSEDSARKRVDRAMDKLRKFFHEHGIQTDSAALAVALTHQSRTAVAESLTHRIIHASASPAVAAAAIHTGAIVAASVAISAVVGVGTWGVLRTPSRAAIPVPIPIATPATAPAHTAAERRRETAARIKCGGQMVQIGRAMLDYASKHHGNFPADFGSLVITEEISPRLFVCPDSHNRIPPDLENRSLEEQAIWVNQHSDYICFAKGRKTGSPDVGNNILAYEKDSDHVDGMTMLWDDGHVDYCELASAHRYIQQQLEGKIATAPIQRSQ